MKSQIAFELALDMQLLNKTEADNEEIPDAQQCSATDQKWNGILSCNNKAFRGKRMQTALPIR